MSHRFAADALPGARDDSDFREIRFQSVPETVVENIRQAILNGRLRPGERLVEQKLAASLRIGQPTLREALKELEHQGFVRKIPKRGTYVTTLTRQDYREILEVRLVLEALAVEKAVPNLSDQIAAELARIVAAMESSAAELDLAEFHANDIAFHRTLWNLCGNRYLAAALERIAFALFAFVLLQREPSSVNEFLDSARQHRQILAGLCSGDPAIARQAFIESTLHFWNHHHGTNLGANGAPIRNRNSRP
ncbi:MAG: GntR family transcriptional regulator [Bryobacteraceae bacterium]